MQGHRDAALRAQGETGGLLQVHRLWSRGGEGAVWPRLQRQRPKEGPRRAFRDRGRHNKSEQGPAREDLRAAREAAG